jgi:hypothetical protein
VAEVPGIVLLDVVSNDAFFVIVPFILSKSSFFGAGFENEDDDGRGGGGGKTEKVRLNNVEPSNVTFGGRILIQLQRNDNDGVGNNPLHNFIWWEDIR